MAQIDNSGNSNNFAQSLRTVINSLIGTAIAGAAWALFSMSEDISALKSASATEDRSMVSVQTKIDGLSDKVDTLTGRFDQCCDAKRNGQ